MIWPDWPSGWGRWENGFGSVKVKGIGMLRSKNGKDAVSSERRVLTVRVGEARFALDVTGVREVLRECAVFPAPLAGSPVAGIMNLRGDVVTVLDLGALLETGESASGARTVMVRDGEEVVGLQVDEVFDVLDITGKELFALDESSQSLPAGRVAGGFYHGEVLYGVVDLPAVLNPEERSWSSE